MSFIATHDTLIKNIDLYDTPIDLRPLPKKDTVANCIEYLRNNRDYYGVSLLERMQDEEAKDIKDTERPREEESRGKVRTESESPRSGCDCEYDSDKRS